MLWVNFFEEVAWLRKIDRSYHASSTTTLEQGKSILRAFFDFPLKLAPLKITHHMVHSSWAQIREMGDIQGQDSNDTITISWEEHSLPPSVFLM